MTVSEGIAEAARLLQEAEATLTPIEPIRTMIHSVEDAYAVQAHVMAPRETPSNPRVGHKVGLTSEAVQRQLGVDSPDYGRLLKDMWITDGVIDMSSLIQPKVEAEIAFILGEDVSDPSDPAAVTAAVAWVAPALEIVDSRIRDWRIALLDTVADNASSARFLLGAERVALEDVDLLAATMTMTVDGEPRSAGRGSDCLGDPRNALAWVARMAAAQGRGLRRHDIVLSGALGPMVALTPDMSIRATISGVGTVEARTKKVERS